MSVLDLFLTNEKPKDDDPVILIDVMGVKYKASNNIVLTGGIVFVDGKENRKLPITSACIIKVISGKSSIKNNKYTYNYYDKRGNKINKKSINKYLNNIYIPPAYNNVMINKNKDAKVLAIGVDKKGRKQYIYNKKSIIKNSNIR